MRGLANRRVVIASGATGIGAAAAERLGGEGARLVVGDINEAGVEATVARILAAGGTAEAVRYDLTDGPSIEAMMARCVELYGGIDALVIVGADLSMARRENGKDLSEMEIEVWERTFSANVTGHGLVIRAALPHMIRAGRGAIATVTSLAATEGYPGQPAYSTSKAAQHALIRHVAARWGKDNIRCNGVAPGFILTQALKDEVDQATLDEVVANLPMTRLGTPEDIAASLAFLISDESSWMTGQIININGGASFRD